SQHTHASWTKQIVVYPYVAFSQWRLQHTPLSPSRHVGGILTRFLSPLFLPLCFIAMIRSKLPDVGTTIFIVMSRLAIEHQAINLGQGFPDFDPDPKLCELVAKAMSAGHNQYPYMPGVAPLRQAIAEKT